MVAVGCCVIFLKSPPPPFLSSHQKPRTNTHTEGERRKEEKEENTHDEKITPREAYSCQALAASLRLAPGMDARLRMRRRRRPQNVACRARLSPRDQQPASTRGRRGNPAPCPRRRTALLRRFLPHTRTRRRRRRRRSRRRNHRREAASDSRGGTSVHGGRTAAPAAASGGPAHEGGWQLCRRSSPAQGNSSTDADASVVTPHPPIPLLYPCRAFLFVWPRVYPFFYLNLLHIF